MKTKDRIDDLLKRIESLEASRKGDENISFIASSYAQARHNSDVEYKRFGSAIMAHAEIIRRRREDAD